MRCGLELAGRVQELEASRRRLVEVGDEERLALVERLRTGAGGRLATLEARHQGHGRRRIAVRPSDRRPRRSRSAGARPTS